jgi:hypothetical protein
MIEIIERKGSYLDEDSHPETRTVFKLGSDHATAPPASCLEYAGCERQISGERYHGDAGRSAGMLKVPSTSSTKVRSSRRMKRFACDVAKFSRPSGSDFRRLRYAS